MHIGHKIEQVVREKRLSISELASQICCTRNNVYKIFGRKSIDTELLERIARILDYDFFKDLSESYSKKV